VADGRIVRVSDGLLVEDLDGDGFEGTGWTILYMHVSENDRVALGSWVEAGDALGHPSCEGGPANGTHLHIAAATTASGSRPIRICLSFWMIGFPTALG
jgi:hypothetical protein